jgi:hypothetical protein
MKTSHKKIRIKWGRLAAITGMIATAIVAGYESRAAFPAEPVSAWYLVFLLAGFGLFCYFAEFVGKKPQASRRRAYD